MHKTDGSSVTGIDELSEQSAGGVSGTRTLVVGRGAVETWQARNQSGGWQSKGQVEQQVTSQQLVSRLALHAVNAQLSLEHMSEP